MGDQNMKYTVTGHATVVCSMIVEASNEEEAIKKANEEFGSLSNYSGMGGCDKLVGVNTPEDDRCIYPDSDVEFDDVLPYVEEQLKFDFHGGIMFGSKVASTREI